MGRKGWWRQIQTDDYPETKTYYGNPRAVNRRPDDDSYTGIVTKDEPTKLEKRCPKCKQTYWIDKGCTNCGYGQKDEETSSDNVETTFEFQKPVPPKKLPKKRKKGEQYNRNISLAELKIYCDSIKLKCKKCRHQRVLDMEFLYEKFDSSYKLKDMLKKLYCSKCNAKEFHVEFLN